MPFSLSSTYLELQKGERLTTNSLPHPYASVLLSNAYLKADWIRVRRPEGGEKGQAGSKGEQWDNSK